MNGPRQRPGQSQRPGGGASPARGKRSGRGPRPPAAADSGPDPRRLALDLLRRIDTDGAYANLVVPKALDNSRLSRSDRGLVTDLVYGTTRQRRALDSVLANFVSRRPEHDTAWILRMGAYQLLETDCAPHAAVDATVSLAARHQRGFVNGVLRNLARSERGFVHDRPAVELSYPDWIFDRFVDDLGEARALEFLTAMNQPAESIRRRDGYIQGRSSAAVVDALPLRPGDLAVDLCAAPGGKASAMASAGARVVAADARSGRVALMRRNFDSVGCSAPVLVADGAHPAMPEGVADLVLLDAPCSGLGVLHGRPDARWRIQPTDVVELADLQQRLIEAAALIVRPGGTVAYSVCTVTASETTEVITSFARRHPDWSVSAPSSAPWTPHGPGALIPPHGQDAMFAAHLHRPADG